jgi:hypothetical protein
MLVAGITFSWKGLWNALRETQINLSILQVFGSECAMDEMFAYLLSYNGLQTLEICDLQMDDQAAEDLAAQKFWHDVIPHHRHSLIKLSAYSRFESIWCSYGPPVATALRQCLSLRDLTISIIRAKMLAYLG